MNRAYSLLTIKEVDDEQRVITGIASTPTVDRIGDTVDPMGAKFKTPMPLLLYHDNKRPCGTVEFAQPTKDGIPFRAKIPRVSEPGIVRDRVDEAWHSVKYKLTAATSIGFKPLEGGVEYTKTGTNFKLWEWLELSLCAIPANPEAIIQGFKSMDPDCIKRELGVSESKSIDTQQRRAASGLHDVRVVRLDVTAGASAQKAKPEEGRPMDVAANIKSFEAKRMASADRAEAIMAKAAEEGRTLDESEDEEYKTVTAEVKSVDEHLKRLHDLESMQASRAKPVTSVKSVDDGGRAREPSQAYIRLEEQLPKGYEFSRYVRCMVAARFNPMHALEIAKHHFPDQHRLQTVLKAAVAAGTTTNADWAGSLVEYNTLASEFIEFLRPQTIIGKFGTGGIPALHSVPFNIRIPFQTTGGEGYWVGQGKAKPLTNVNFDTRTFPFAKVANIAVLTDELVRFSNPSADSLTRQALADALRRRLDLDFIDPAKAAVANVSPASITNGITGIASAGSGVDGVRADLEAVLASFTAAGLTPNAIIMSAGNALALSMMVGPLGQRAFSGITANGGDFNGLPVIISEYVTQVGDTGSSPIIFLNTNEIYMADDGTVTIDASREASLEMSDAPAHNSDTPTGGSLVSMWQTNSVALKAERYIYWERRRDAGVAWIEAAAYTSVSGT